MLPEDTSPNPRSERYFSRLLENRDGEPDNYSSVDLGFTTPVKDQGNCGSCTAFASMAAIEVCFKKNTRRTFDLSEQQLLDCAYGQFSCDGCEGNPIEGFFRWATTNNTGPGLVNTTHYPYQPDTTGESCKSTRLPDNKFVREAQVNATWYTYNGTEDLLKTLVYTHGAAVVSLHAGGTLDKVRAGGQIFAGCTPKQGESRDHAVAVVGYGNGTAGPYWLIKNSWGPRWGDKGYFKLRRGVGMCGIGKHIAVVNCFVSEGTGSARRATTQKKHATTARRTTPAAKTTKNKQKGSN